MNVRLAGLDDTPGVLAVWGEARSAAAVTPDNAAAVALAVEKRALLIAEQDGRIVGALVAGWDGWRGNMYRLAVLTEYRRRGIARALVDAGHEHLREQGARRVTALVGVGEDEAEALWQAAGYTLDTEISRFVRNL